MSNSKSVIAKRGIASETSINSPNPNVSTHTRRRGNLATSLRVIVCETTWDIGMILSVFKL